MDFTAALTLGAGLLAAWLDVRLGDVRPAELAQRLLHATLGVFALLGAVGLLYLVHGVPQGLFMVAVFAVFLPALVYSLLATLWMLRTLTDLAGVAR